MEKTAILVNFFVFINCSWLHPDIFNLIRAPQPPSPFAVFKVIHTIQSYKQAFHPFLSHIFLANFSIAGNTLLRRDRILNLGQILSLPKKTDFKGCPKICPLFCKVACKKLSQEGCYVPEQLLKAYV